ncbi:MAG: Gfo/Idh/MocA family oxidoreductase [Algibacter sp.]|uniref:Gfo/Idh/MocA family protein n=1 Tax=Algibacter sp. TaxID=1872428 RepID=UPI00261519B6|nr:Gfo/Idh/MocA family oxidoreductase [Algibacter sp.]MDG1729544.1 Gfo/Idh/MocA family oxidoreductase [Algibacter sp.]MDG2177712.1 Gfo/Idh/MocA family oxidoreductase [Algibacter sp.]
MNWGFIGCGSVTEVKSGPAFQQTEGFNVVAVMRRNEEKLEDYAKRHNIQKTFTDAEALINDPNIDAVYIATPPDTHQYYALKVAKAGKPCCIEKPLSPSYAESLEIQKAFEARSIPLFVAYYRRSLPRFLKVKEWLANNYIGDVRHISAHLSKPASKIDTSKIYNWRTDVKVAPAGYFDDLASHGLDLFTFFLGDVVDAKGFSLNQQGLYSSKDAVTASWLHKKGITGSGIWNFGSNSHLDTVTIFGSKGTIEFSVFHDNPIILKSDTKNEELFIENPKHIQEFHVQNISDFFNSKIKLHPSTGKTALHTSWIMDKILGEI